MATLQMMTSERMRKVMLVGGSVLAIGGIGLVVYAIAWVMNSNVFKALAPVIGFFKSLLASFAAHPIAWIAAIGVAIALVIGGPLVYNLVQYMRECRLTKIAMETTNKVNVSKGEPETFTKAEIAAIDVQLPDFSKVSLMERARALLLIDNPKAGSNLVQFQIDRTALQAQYVYSQRIAEENKQILDAYNRASTDAEADALQERMIQGTRNAQGANRALDELSVNFYAKYGK